jgi:hypothetical protein
MIVNQNLILRQDDFEFFSEIEKFLYEDFIKEKEKKYITYSQSAYLFFDLFDFLLENNDEINLDINKKENLIEKIKVMKLNFF